MFVNIPSKFLEKKVPLYNELYSITVLVRTSAHNSFGKPKIPPDKSGKARDDIPISSAFESL